MTSCAQPRPDFIEDVDGNAPCPAALELIQHGAVVATGLTQLCDHSGDHDPGSGTTGISPSHDMRVDDAVEVSA